MKLALFGATGGTGRQIIDLAIRQGHQIKALVRRPAALPAKENLEVIGGNVLDEAAVSETVSGTDAVICALGQTGDNPGHVTSEGTRHIIKAMEQQGIGRLIVITSLGVGDSKDQVPTAFKMLMKTVLRKTMQDKELQEQLVRNSALDWTIVRPGGLTDGPATGDYVSGLDSQIMAGQLSRADLAEFVLQQLQDKTYLHQTPAIT